LDIVFLTRGATGDSAGGHLAMMAAMTANQPQYQEGFEDVDTSVRGVISINGVMRTHIDPFFAKHACMTKEPLNKAFLLDHSPVTYVEKAHQQGNLVPSLIMMYVSGIDFTPY
jgi:acetyl esterase/lipase